MDNNNSGATKIKKKMKPISYLNALVLNSAVAVLLGK